MAIILNACITFGRSILKDWKVILIAVLSFFAFFFQWNFVLIFVFAAVAGLLLRPKTPQTKAALLWRGLFGSGEGKRISYCCSSWRPLFAWHWRSLISWTRRLRSSLSIFPRSELWPSAVASPPSLLIQYEMVDRFQWLSTKEFLDGIALGQVTPGPILITATFVGYKVSNLLGAFMATLGVFFPSFFILVLLIPYHDRLRGVEKVRMMEQGILGSFIGMLGSGPLQFWKDLPCRYSKDSHGCSGFLCHLQEDRPSLHPSRRWNAFHPHLMVYSLNSSQR